MLVAVLRALARMEDPEARKLQRVQFHKNMAMLGGLVFAVCADTRQRNEARQPSAHPRTAEAAR